MSSLDLSRFKLQGPLINPTNGTIPMSEFILLGFPSLGQLSCTLLCALLSVTYTGTLASNLCNLWAVLQDPHLQRLPMYILLGNFSWLEICYVTATVPRMLSDLVSPGIPIYLQACFVQFYFAFSMGAIECFFLVAMAFDRYLAICHPLHYPVLMCPKHCWALVASWWLSGFLWFIVPVAIISQLSCGSNTLDHFICDLAPLLAASCTPASRTEQVCHALSSLIIFTTVFFILASYGLVIKAVLRLHSAAKWHKAFSTCASHLAIMGLFYGSVMVTYVKPAASGHSGKVVTLFYAVGTPLLNPLIYSLRNKEMKEALKRTLVREQ